jgi:hypothetical protein
MALQPRRPTSTTLSIVTEVRSGEKIAITMRVSNSKALYCERRNRPVYIRRVRIISLCFEAIVVILREVLRYQKVKKHDLQPLQILRDENIPIHSKQMFSYTNEYKTRERLKL